MNRLIYHKIHTGKILSKFSPSLLYVNMFAFPNLLNIKAISIEIINSNIVLIL